MKALRRGLAIALIALFGFAGGAVALDLAPDKFDEKLKSYDAATVAAAKAYMRTVGMQNVMAKSAPQIRAAVAAQVKAKNPNVNDAQLNVFLETFFRSAFVDSAPVLEQATLLLMLDVLNKQELDALNQFYASPVGQGILTKMPQLMGRMPELMETMQKYVIPNALEKARAEVKKSGVEVKI
jgi:hypothetical protein